MVRHLKKLAVVALLAGATAHADSVSTSSSGATFTTTITAADAFHVTVAPPADQVATTQKFYIALVAWGHLLFGTASGWQEWKPGTPIPAFYENAQSECQHGTFGYTSKPGNLSDLPKIMAGAVYYAGYGVDENDLIVNQKYAAVYAVPLK
ncbi:MAG: hypothetical protein KGZ83_17935 [Sulfuricella sp.]|nr:hypothetical protein [Sulfuricella sp.]